MTVASKQYQGGCLCGAVRYGVNHFHEAIANCHCTMCRKFTGAAYATYASAALVDFNWITGENLLTHYRAENGTTRSFCRHCGSGLVFTAAKPADDIVEIALATIDGDVPVKPDAHIYVDNKANWTEFKDGLALHSQGRVKAETDESSS